MIHSSMIPTLVEKPAGFSKRDQRTLQEEGHAHEMPTDFVVPLCHGWTNNSSTTLHQSSVVFVTHPKPRNTKERNFRASKFGKVEVSCFCVVF